MSHHPYWAHLARWGPLVGLLSVVIIAALRHRPAVALGALFALLVFGVATVCDDRRRRRETRL